MSYCKIAFLFLVVLFLNKQLGFANSNSPLVSHADWVKYSKTYDYTEHFKAQKESKKSSPTKEFSLPTFFSGMSIVVYILIAILILVIITLIVLLILGILKQSNESFSKIADYKVSSYENIENADLEKDLQQVLAMGLYKDALRLRYLIVLRTLTQHHLVVWKMDKTNGSYLQEMYGKKGFEIFRRLTLSFERAWYGDMQITEQDYFHLSPIFDQINLITGQ